MKRLSEPQKRTLARVARLMMTSANCDISLQLRDGGVREYLESMRLNPHEMPVADAEIVAEIEANANSAA